jgi:2-dehydropantoate 2-reductase
VLPGDAPAIAGTTAEQLLQARAGRSAVRIGVLGAGGVGGYYGALLAEQGYEVIFVARGAHLSALLQRGLRIESVHGDFSLYPVDATDDPTHAGVVDLLLVTVKSYDLEEAAEGARAMVGPCTAVLPLLNGLDAADRLAAVLGEGPVLAGLTHLAATVAAPGVIQHTSRARKITFGERNGATTARTQEILRVLSAAGIDAVLSTSIQQALWEKFLFIASISGVCCLARQPMGIVLATPETRQLYLDTLAEVETLARAKGEALAGDVRDRTVRLTEGFPPLAKPSLLIALEAGRPLELEAMTGTVVRLGLEAQIPTPINRAIYAALKPSAGGSSRPP